MATYKTDQVINYLLNLLEYNSSRDAYFKLQNGGSGAHSWSKASENSHNGHSIQVTTPWVDFRV